MNHSQENLSSDCFCQDKLFWWCSICFQYKCNPYTGEWKHRFDKTEVHKLENIHFHRRGYLVPPVDNLQQYGTVTLKVDTKCCKWLGFSTISSELKLSVTETRNSFWFDLIYSSSFHNSFSIVKTRYMSIQIKMNYSTIRSLFLQLIIIRINLCRKKSSYSLSILLAQVSLRQFDVLHVQDWFQYGMCYIICWIDCCIITHMHMMHNHLMYVHLMQDFFYADWYVVLFILLDINFDVNCFFFLFSLSASKGGSVLYLG